MKDRCLELARLLDAEDARFTEAAVALYAVAKSRRELVNQHLSDRRQIAWLAGKVAGLEERLAKMGIERAVALAVLDTSGPRQTAMTEEVARIVKISEERKEFVTLEDGYLYFWPDGSPHGALAPWHLRSLADELDRRNAPWDAQVQAAFSEPANLETKQIEGGNES